jgi:hypothetical protein
MAAATAERQAWLVAEMASHDVQYTEPFAWRALADGIKKEE